MNNGFSYRSNDCSSPVRICCRFQNPFETLGAIIALVIFAIFMSWNLGQFPFYNDLPIATTFLSAIVGILLGSALLGKNAQE